MSLVLSIFRKRCHIKLQSAWHMPSLLLERWNCTLCQQCQRRRLLQPKKNSSSSRTFSLKPRNCWQNSLPFSHVRICWHICSTRKCSHRSGAAAIKAPGPKWTPGTLAEDVSFAGGTLSLSLSPAHTSSAAAANLCQLVLLLSFSFYFSESLSLSLTF